MTGKYFHITEDVEDKIFKEALTLAVTELKKYDNDDGYYKVNALNNTLDLISRTFKSRWKDESDKIVSADNTIEHVFSLNDSEMHILATAMICVSRGGNPKDYDPLSEIGFYMVQFAKFSRVVEAARVLEYEMAYDDFDQMVNAETTSIIKAHDEKSNNR